MARDGDSTGLILLLGVAGVAVYGYFQGWFASLGLAPAGIVVATATTPPAGAATTAAPVTSTSVVPVVSPTPVSTIPANASAAGYSGPSLATMLADLQAVEAAAFGVDPALTSSASNPVATKDVHNWYLVNRANVGVSTPPSSNGDETPLSLTDYWAWAAPQLQAQMPGLSGLGYVYAGLGELVREMRGW